MNITNSISKDMSKPKTNQTRPCSDCPFRGKSHAGWLGPYTAIELHQQVMAEQPFSCHQTITHDDDQDVEETELCVGSILYMNKNCKLARSGYLKQQQQRWAGVGTEGILSTLEFLDHHADNVQDILNVNRKRRKYNG